MSVLFRTWESAPNNPASYFHLFEDIGELAKFLSTMVYLKIAQLVLPLLALSFERAQALTIQVNGSSGHPVPRRTISGVQVVDTPIVRDAHDFALNHSSDFVYKHIMRSWLFGALIIEHNETLRSTVDLEVHAVAALLHDLGWDQTPDSPFISHDKRFEVDGAIAAREFIQNGKYGQEWDGRRVQLAWDSIALHTQPSIYNYKELEVATTGNGIWADFKGPELGITKEEYSAVVSEFPSDGMRDGMNDTMIWLCQGKPATTYGRLTSLETTGRLLMSLQTPSCSLGEITMSRTTTLRETGFLMSRLRISLNFRKTDLIGKLSST